MDHQPVWLRGLVRYLVVILTVGPVVGIILVWTWMTINGLSPERKEIFDRGNLTIGVLLVTGAIGVALELFITPMLRRDSRRTHWGPRRRP